MKRWTLAEIRTKIEQDLDLEAEDFIGADELLGIINEGIDECEAHIHMFGREHEYFLKEGALNLIQGQSDYALPTDIYANKILALNYVKGTTIYPIKRLRNIDRFLLAELLRMDNPPDSYQYLLTHADAADGYRIKLFPAALESGNNLLKLWYIRNANKHENDSDICDIPEFVYYILAFAKYQVLFKEGHPNAQEAHAALEKQKNLMFETLGEMVPDEDNKLVMDTSHYEEST